MTDVHVFDEPVATGWARIELRGNKELARSYLHQGRILLGNLRIAHGVNQRIAEGESGGFYSRFETLPDGTVIHVTTNNGQDSIKILAPERQPTPQDRAKKQREKHDFIPYLWVGVRHIEGGYQDYLSYPGGEDWVFTGTDDPGLIARPHLCVFEPVQAANQPRRCVSNRDYLYQDYYAELEAEGPADKTWYPMGRNRDQYEGSVETLEVRDGTTRQDEFHWNAGEPFLDADDMEPAGKYRWVAVIKSKQGIEATPGDYVIKCCITGFDGVPITPAKFMIKVIVGKAPGVTVVAQHEISQAQPNFTTMRRATLPRGFYFNRTDDPIDQWYFGTFWMFHPSIIDYGTNPHGANWWQGGFKITMPPSQYGVDEQIGPVVDLVKEGHREYPLIPREPRESDTYWFDPDGSFPPAPDHTYDYFGPRQGLPEWAHRSPSADTTSIMYYKHTLPIATSTQKLQIDGYWRDDSSCSNSGSAGTTDFDPWSETLYIHWTGLAENIPIYFDSSKSGRSITMTSKPRGDAKAPSSLVVRSSDALVTSADEPCLGGRLRLLPNGTDYESSIGVDPFYAVFSHSEMTLVPANGVGDETGSTELTYLGTYDVWESLGGVSSNYFLEGASSSSDAKLYLTGFRYQ